MMDFDKLLAMPFGDVAGLFVQAGRPKEWIEGLDAIGASPLFTDCLDAIRGGADIQSTIDWYYMNC